ncbi:hypothetical protein ACFFNY_07625 [Paenibacillus hodogayensis]|uniref:Alpha/beta hydrolase n=1 Tax=Paenibacillus hodogayensis TaxID=279208 RepID=A0ABV5VT08_9BACL
MRKLSKTVPSKGEAQADGFSIPALTVADDTLIQLPADSAGCAPSALLPRTDSLPSDVPAAASPLKAAVFAAAGVYTSPNFMEGVLERIARTLTEQAGMNVVRSALLFPYGDWSSGLFRQIRQVRRDMSLPVHAFDRSLGGRMVLEALDDCSAADLLFLIGHSGGGVAAVHAAMQLRRLAGAPHIRIAQIGCPRGRIASELRPNVRYLYAVHPAGGAPKDPICRIGSWGGWESGTFGLPRWNPLKHAPGERIPVPIIGGHADYFRERPPFLDQAGRSNLDIVAENMLRGLIVRNGSEAAYVPPSPENAIPGAQSAIRSTDPLDG